MKTANSVNLKWLKIFHLFAAILWIGCGIAMNLLRVTITPTTPEGMFTLSLALFLPQLFTEHGQNGASSSSIG